MNLSSETPMGRVRSNQLQAAMNEIASPDPRVRADAIERLVELSANAAEALIPLARDAADDVRAAAMDALARIAVAAAVPAFREGLRDRDERVRSHAARGLTRLGHEDALQACLSTIDDNPDPLHLDSTPSAHALGDMGLKAVAPLLDLMGSADRDTRMHAQRALELLIARRFGFQPGRGFLDSNAQKAVHRLWQANDDYDFAASAERRDAAIDHWRRWLSDIEA
jgi:HEAT repeat protein